MEDKISNNDSERNSGSMSNLNGLDVEIEKNLFILNDDSIEQNQLSFKIQNTKEIKSNEENFDSKELIQTRSINDSSNNIKIIEMKRAFEKTNVSISNQENDNAPIKLFKTSCLDKKKAFVWTDYEAFKNQHEQSGASACGATAIINVLKGLKFEFDHDLVCSQVKINLRIPESLATQTTLAQYLFSRSVAGMNSFEMIQNIEKVTSNKVTGRFYPFSITKSNDLIDWLCKWIKKGAVPVALLNLQKTIYQGIVPDAWHHQMIYACDENHIYLTNPLEKKPLEEIKNELNSESCLLVRSSDVIYRFKSNPTNLNELVDLNNFDSKEKQRWLDLNVIGQVVNVLRQSNLASQELSDEFKNVSDLNFNQYYFFTSKKHIKIPASYIPGITLFCIRNSTLYNEIFKETD